MTLSNTHVDRGKRGHTPEMTTRADQSYLEYLTEARTMMLNEKGPTVHEAGLTSDERPGHPFRT